MPEQTTIPLVEAWQQLPVGDPHQLLTQLGLPDSSQGFQAIQESLKVQSIRELKDLRIFLHQYRDQILVPTELDAVARAYRHAEEFQLRELIALDQKLSSLALLKDFAAASKCIGRSQLRMLKPLRDQKLLHRYLQAIDKGEAAGWHTLVYGVVLATYALPLRPGLLRYAQQTFTGFASGDSCPIQLEQASAIALVEESMQPIPRAIDTLMESTGIGQIRLV